MREKLFQRQENIFSESKQKAENLKLGPLKYRPNLESMLCQSYSTLNFGLGIVSNILQYINPCVPIGFLLSCW